MMMYKIILLILLSINGGCSDKISSEEESSLIDKKPDEDVKKHHIEKLNTIEAILNHIEKPSLVVLDIDATLIWVPGHTWPFKDVKKISLAEGDHTLSMIKALQNLSSNDSKTKGVKVIFLTARSAAEPALAELNAVHINFSTQWLDGIKLSFDGKKGYKDGILYTNHTDKGLVLNQFLSEISKEYEFESVLFVDDQEDNVNKVHKALKENNSIKRSIVFQYIGAVHPDLELTREILGQYSFEVEPYHQMVRFKKNGSVLSRDQFLTELSDQAVSANYLRQLINKVVTIFYDKDKSGIKVKSPVISKATKDEPFFWLFQPQKFTNADIQDTYKHYFVHCSPAFNGSNKNDADYVSRFLGIVDGAGVHNKAAVNSNTYKNATVFFSNLGSDPGQLVVPCPLDTDVKAPKNQSLLSLGTYAQFLEDNKAHNDAKERLNSLWSAVGAATKSLVNNHKHVYLHTHGTGVRYLHVRIDHTPYDYGDGMAKTLVSEPGASQLYQKVFQGK